MKKIAFAVGAMVFVLGIIGAAAVGFYMFFSHTPFEGQTVTVSVLAIDEKQGKSPCLFLETEETLYEIPSVWLQKLKKEAFKENFVCGKEYTLTVDRHQAENGKDYIVTLLYGLADEQQVYLSPEDAAALDNGNVVLGLIMSVGMMAALLFLIGLVLYHRRSVIAFLRELYGGSEKIVRRY